MLWAYMWAFQRGLIDEVSTIPINFILERCESPMPCQFLFRMPVILKKDIYYLRSHTVYSQAEVLFNGIFYPIYWPSLCLKLKKCPELCNGLSSKLWFFESSENWLQKTTALDWVCYKSGPWLDPLLSSNPLLLFTVLSMQVVIWKISMV